MGSTMEIENQALFIEGVDDGSGGNPQRGYFAVFKAIGPFLSKVDAEKAFENTE